MLDPPEKDDDRRQGSRCVLALRRRPAVPFHVSATDTDGNLVDLAMPLIFVGKEETDDDYDDSIMPDASPLQYEKVQAAYESATWPGTVGKRADRAAAAVRRSPSARAPSATTPPSRSNR